MILGALFLRWCHLMWQLMKGEPHRAINFTMQRDGKLLVLCTCGRRWR